MKLTAVKERELPKADDEFAKLASEFDTIKELRADLEKQIEKSKVYGQGIQARDLLTEQLIKLVKVPVSDELIEDDVHRHLEREGRLQDAEHRAEVKEESTKSFQAQIILDEIAETEKLQVNEQELLQYLVATSQQYGMDANQFIRDLNENGQIPSFVGEVARRKALTIILEAAEVTDSKGKKVDLAEFFKSDVEPIGEDSHEGHDH